MPVPRPRLVTVPIPEATPVDAAVAQASSMRESQQAYDQGSQFGQLTSARIDRAATGRVQSTAVVRRPVSDEVTQVIALFKGARSARQAVLASIILSPPPALEQSSTLF